MSRSSGAHCCRGLGAFGSAQNKRNAPTRGIRAGSEVGGSCPCQGTGVGCRDVPAVPAPAEAADAGGCQGPTRRVDGSALTGDGRAPALSWQPLLVSIAAALCELSPGAQPALGAPHSVPPQAPPCSRGRSPHAKEWRSRHQCCHPVCQAGDTSETGITLDPHPLLNYQRGY